jgi:hypothetical protein
MGEVDAGEFAFGVLHAHRILAAHVIDGPIRSAATWSPEIPMPIRGSRCTNLTAALSCAFRSPEMLIFLLNDQPRDPIERGHALHMKAAACSAEGGRDAV